MIGVESGESGERIVLPEIAEVVQEIGFEGVVVGTIAVVVAVAHYAIYGLLQHPMAMLPPKM